MCTLQAIIILTRETIITMSYDMACLPLSATYQCLIDPSMILICHSILYCSIKQLCCHSASILHGQMGAVHANHYLKALEDIQYIYTHAWKKHN